MKYWVTAFIPFFYLLLFTLFFFFSLYFSGLQHLASSDPVSFWKYISLQNFITSFTADRSVVTYVIHTDGSTVQWRLNEITICGYLLASFPYISWYFLWHAIGYMWVHSKWINPYPTAFPYGNGMVLHFYQQEESSTTKTVTQSH